MRRSSAKLRRKLHIEKVYFGEEYGIIRTKCGRKLRRSSTTEALAWHQLKIWLTDNFIDTDEVCKTCLNAEPGYATFRRKLGTEHLVSEFPQLVPKLESYAAQMSPSAALRQILSDLRQLLHEMENPP